MQFDNTKALDAADALPVQPVAPRSDRSAWGAPWRAVKAGAADVLGSTADVLKGFGAASAMTLEADPVARSVLGAKAVEQGAAAGRKQIAAGDSLSSAVGDSFRQVSRDMRPDPATASTAEQIVFGAVRPITKLVGAGLAAGPIGLGLAAAEEGFTAADDLRRAGVDPLTRTKVGTLTAAATGAGAFLPLAGPTLKATAGLYLAGGPGAFMAQQAATRSILERADYTELARQYDPFDPLGLTLSALIPLPFAAHGAARNVRAMRGEVVPAPAAAPVEPVAREAVDAAMAHNLTTLNDLHEAVIPEAAALERVRLDAVAAKEVAPVPDAVRLPDAAPVQDASPPAPSPTGPDFGRLASAVESARNLIAEAQAQGKSIDMLLTERKVLDEVNNVVVGLRDAAQDPRRMAALVQRLVQEARDMTKPAADATADAVEGMRSLTDQQLRDIETPAKSSADPLTQSVANRIKEVETAAPNMAIRTTEDGQIVTVADELARVRKEAAEGTDTELGSLDADLLRVAAECALSIGGA